VEFARNRHRKDGLAVRCKGCAHAYYLQHSNRIRAGAKRWAESNPETVKMRNRRYYEANAERLRVASAAYYHANLKASRAARRAYYRKHKQQIKAYQTWYRKEHLTEIRDYKRERLANSPAKRAKQNEANRRYAKRHPGVVRRGNLNRELRQKLADSGSFTREQADVLLENCGNRCLKCNRHASETPEQALELDHVIPLSSIDPSSSTPLTKRERELQLISNIQPLCRRCNRAKGTKETDYRSPKLRRFLKKLAER
jgi:5-methylcytosine-specific restriction endonuclease McrA